MRYSNRLMGRTFPFIPLSGSDAGLLEKRLNAASDLGLSDSAEFVGEWDSGASSGILLDSDVEFHKNNAEDPATDTVNISDDATSVWDFNRGITSNVSLNQFAHASLDGYHPPGSGTGDPDLSKHTMTSAGAISKGMPVYVSSNNVVDTANAVPSAGPVYTRTFPCGFANSTTTGNGQSIEVLTEGHIELTDWTAIAGSANLTVGSRYYLQESAGTIGTVAPTTDGSKVIWVGYALTTKKLDIEIGEGVRL
jgi:hypothetical protein